MQLASSCLFRSVKYHYLHFADAFSCCNFLCSVAKHVLEYQAFQRLPLHLVGNQPCARNKISQRSNTVCMASTTLIRSREFDHVESIVEKAEVMFYGECSLKYFETDILCTVQGQS